LTLALLLVLVLVLVLVPPELALRLEPAFRPGSSP